MLCDHVRKLQLKAYEQPVDYEDEDGGDDDGSLGWLLRELMALLSPRFPPAALALHQLAEAADITDAGINRREMSFRVVIRHKTEMSVTVENTLRKDWPP